MKDEQRKKKRKKDEQRSQSQRANSYGRDIRAFRNSFSRKHFDLVGASPKPSHSRPSMRAQVPPSRISELTGTVETDEEGGRRGNAATHAGTRSGDSINDRGSGTSCDELFAALR